MHHASARRCFATISETRSSTRDKTTTVSSWTIPTMRNPETAEKSFFLVDAHPELGRKGLALGREYEIALFGDLARRQIPTVHQTFFTGDSGMNKRLAPFLCRTGEKHVSNQGKDPTDVPLVLHGTKKVRATVTWVHRAGDDGGRVRKTRCKLPNENDA